MFEWMKEFPANVIDGLIWMREHPEAGAVLFMLTVVGIGWVALNIASWRRGR